MVAFMILAMAMGIALQTINLGSRSVAVADERRAVLALAETLRAERLNDPNLTRAGGALEGQTDRLKWNIRIVAKAEPSSVPEGEDDLLILQIFVGSLGTKRYEFLLHRVSPADD
jgi:type II secretory pathway pseudopilin PulG